MQIDTAIIRASLIADSQISARLADAVVAFVSSLRLWKHCGCLTIHGPQITTWNSSLLWTLSAGVNWAKPEPAFPLCLPTGPGDSCRNTYLCYLCEIFFTCQHTEMFHVQMNTLPFGDRQGGNLLWIFEAMLRTVLFVPASCRRTGCMWRGEGSPVHHSVRSDGEIRKPQRRTDKGKYQGWYYSMGQSTYSVCAPSDRFHL